MALELTELDRAIQLAHLDVDAEKKALYFSQIQVILTYMDQLNALDLSDVSPSAHAHDEGTVLREDVVVTHTDLLLEENAPAWEDGVFMVPKILAG